MQSNSFLGRGINDYLTEVKKILTSQEAQTLFEKLLSDEKLQ